MSYSTVTLTGKVIGPTGSPSRANLAIVTNAERVVDAAGKTVLAGSVTIAPDSTGAFSVSLPATDDTRLTPSGFQYRLLGPHGIDESFYLPASLGTVDLAALITVAPAPIPAESLTDATVRALIDNPTSGVRASLFGTYAARGLGNIDATVRKLADDFADVNILVLGDSTAAQANQWPDQLLPQVQALYPHRTLEKATWDNTGHAWGSFAQVGPAGTGTFKIKFWQGAVSGTVCEQPLNYFDTWVGRVQPDLVVVHYGHNYGKTAADGGQPSDAVMDQVFRERYLRFVAEIKKACPRADVLVTSQNPYLTTGTRAQLSNIRAQTIREVAADLGCAYGPILEKYLALGNEATQATYLSGDGLHPLTSGATNGAAVAASAVLPIFKKDDAHEISARQPSPLTETATNLLTNGDFIEFVSGTLTGWTAQNVTLTKDTTNYESTNGYSIKGTGTADNANNQIYQSLPIRRVRGRVVTFSARFYVDAAQTSGSVGRVTLTSNGTGAATMSSGTITSVRNNWVWVSVTARIPDDATSATALILFGGAVGHEASVDRATVCLGSLPKDAHPRAALTSYQTQVNTTEDALTTGEIVPRRNLMDSNAVAHTSGTLALSYFTADKTETINNVTLYTGNTAAGATPSLCRVGIYSLDGSGNGTLVASTANDTALFAAANTAYTKALSSAFNKVEGTRYAVALLVTSNATMPSFMGPLAVANAPAQVVMGLAPRLVGRLTGQTDLPASFTEAGLTAYSLRSHVLLKP